jgi:hypothetical protein
MIVLCRGELLLECIHDRILYNSAPWPRALME